MWQNSSKATCYEQMVPITITELGRGYVIGRERVISKVNRSFTAVSPPRGAASAGAVATGATVYLYELGVLVKTEAVSGSTVSLSLNGPLGSLVQQLGIIVWAW